MIQLTATLQGVPEVRRDLRRANDKVKLMVRNVLEAGGLRVIAEARQVLDRICIRGGGDPESGRIGLGQSLWSDPAYFRGGTVYEEVGWGLPHGPVLEFGPTVRKWEIHPRTAQALRVPFWMFTARVQAGVAALRQQVMYFKHVTHWWDRSQLRPHFNPALQTCWPQIEADLAEIPKRAIEG